MSQTQKPDKARRDFLRGAAIATAIPLATTLTTAQAEVANSNTAEEAAPKKNKGYELTQHISDYYKSAAS